MKLLIVEDDKKTASYLKKGLSENGFIVDVSRDGEEGLYLAKQLTYDLLILDLMLPVRDGWSILAELRKGGSEIPVLLLSALGDLTARVRGLSMGADDYMVKPFAFSELLARVRSILRRRAGRHTEMVQVLDLQIDVSRHKVKRGESQLDLTPKEFHLLLLLASRPGEVFSRTLIAEQIWDMNFDSDSNVVDVHIRRLRSKMDDPFETKLIQTVRGLGYVLSSQRIPDS